MAAKLKMTGSALPILTFHALADETAVTSFSPRVFRRGMARLHENGYRSLSLTDAADCLRNQQPLPRRSFVITFDDGYASVYEEGLPVLRDYGMRATVFLTVGETRTAESAGRLPSLGGRSMLSWQEIKEMRNCSVSFGAHTLTHPDLTHLPVERIEAEICRSKEIIEDALGDPVRCFAYPYGRYDRRSREIVQQHFACACSDRLGLTRTDSDLYALERVDAYYLRTDRLFDLMLTKVFPWYIAARSIPRQLRRAVQLS
jgi:peptidoglycan/xylan/chitin deacetylase (PgdA/CDA1 family)